MTTSKDIINEYIGKQRIFQVFDCWTLVKEIYSKLGYELFELSHEEYQQNWASKGLNIMLDNADKEWVKIESYKQFDCVLFQNKKGVAYHIGIMLDQFKFIHCTKYGVAVNRIHEPRWLQRIEGFYRHKERLNV